MTQWPYHESSWHIDDAMSISWESWLLYSLSDRVSMSSWHKDDSMSISHIVLGKVAVESVSMSSWHIDDPMSISWETSWHIFDAMNISWESWLFQMHTRVCITQRADFFWQRADVFPDEVIESQWVRDIHDGSLATRKPTFENLPLLHRLEHRALVNDRNSQISTRDSICYRPNH